MSLLLFIRPCRYTCWLACILLLGYAASVHADPKPLSKEEQAKVDKAIDKGVAYLKRTQTKEGNWPTHWKNRFLVGECALPAYALLEAGVPANDPAIQKAAAFIRPKVANTDDTYELSLAVLFFDRLGDAKDKKLIQTCALRLIAGQYRTGGWSYICPRFKEASQEADLLTALEELSKQIKDEKSTKEALKELALPESTLIWPLEPPWPVQSRIDYQDFRRKIRHYQLPRKLKGFKGLAVFQDLEKLNWREQTNRKDSKESYPLVGVTDNSNTQFALLALWVAQRHGTPTEPTFRLLVERFERSQYPNGDWNYLYTHSLKEKLEARRGRPSMICVGLLGLAIGRGLKFPTPLGSPPSGKEDLRILTGLAALYSTIGVPAGQMDEPIPMQDIPMRDIYFLWSLERVGMLFNLQTLGDKEWYRWGAEILVTNQLDTGEFNAADWAENKMYSPTGAGQASPGFYGPILKTAFALLFLKHSHPMKDLTPKLPFTPKELNEGIARLRSNDSRLERSTPTPSRNTKPER
ncbi:MAG TPA: hypothetical protein VH575_05455 [Gemmataceae bacterium]|jgi:hypothetical protein